MHEFSVYLTKEAVWLLILLKLLIYSIWGMIGFKFVSQAKLNFRDVMGSGLVLGIFRLVIGLVLGVAIFVISSMVYGTIKISDEDMSSRWTAYLVIYFPSRVIMWWIAARFGRFDISSSETRLLPWNMIAWIVGGVLLSTLTDIPWYLSWGKIPVLKGGPCGFFTG